MLKTFIYSELDQGGLTKFAIYTKIRITNLDRPFHQLVRLERFKSSQICKGWGQSAKLGTHSAICSKLGTALQAYALNPCTKFAANPTSRKVNT